MVASYHDRTGHWEMLRLTDGVNLLCGNGPAFGLSIGGRPALPHTRRLVTAVTDPAGRWCEMLYVHGDMRVMHRVELHDRAATMTQMLVVELLTGLSLPRTLTDVWWRWPGLSLDDRRNNFLYAADHEPRPFASVTEPMNIDVDPEHQPALAAMENRAMREAEHIVAVWQAGENHVTINLAPDTDGLNVEMHLPMRAELRAGRLLQYAKSYLAVAGDAKELLTPQRRVMREF